jgi:hypothetical protein
LYVICLRVFVSGILQLVDHLLVDVGDPITLNLLDSFLSIGNALLVFVFVTPDIVPLFLSI